MRLSALRQGFQKGLLKPGLVTMTLSLAVIWVATTAATASDLKGIWLDHTARGAVEIYDCGSSICGRLVWMKNPIKPSGEPFRDKRNSEPSLRNRTICGIQLIGRLRPDGAGDWGGGWIYDPERGQRFDLKVSQQGTNRLTITGYLVNPIFGKSFNWTRAAEDIGRCAPAVKAATAQ